MPTPEEQLQYARLSAELQRLGRTHSDWLPGTTASLRLHLIDGKPYLDAFDRVGKMVAMLRSDQTPHKPMQAAIERLASQPCPDPDGITCLL